MPKNPFKKKDDTVQASQPTPTSEAKWEKQSTTPATGKFANLLAGTEKKKSKRKFIIIALIAVVLVALLIGLTFCKKGQKGEGLTEGDFTALAPSAFQSAVELKGNISSDKEVELTAETPAPVTELLVKEGDTVQKGDVIARLDGRKLRQQIRQQEAQVGMTAKQAASQVRTARNRYNAAVRALENGTNASITAAQASLVTAENAYHDAEAAYQSYVSDLNQGYDAESMTSTTAVENARIAVRQAELAYNQAKDNYARNRSDYSTGNSDANAADTRQENLRRERDRLTDEVAHLEARIAEADAVLADPSASSQDKQSATDNKRVYVSTLATYKKNLRDIEYDLTQAQSDYASAIGEKDAASKSKYNLKQAVDQAEIALDQAKATLRQAEQTLAATKKHGGDKADQLARARDTAYANYQNAVANLRTTQDAASTELNGLEDAMIAAQVTASDPVGVATLANLYDDLEAMTIRAPMAGTITQVYVKEGQTASGTVARMEALDQLLAVAEAKDTEAKQIRKGMRVEITSDATGDEVYKGEVVYVAKAATGSEAPQMAAGAAAGAMALPAATNSDANKSKPTYTVKVAVHTPEGTLLEGMRVRINIITAEDQGVYGVPQSAVYDTADGQKAVIVARGDGPDYTLEEVVVTTSISNDASIVIEGKDLEDGDLVMNTADESKIGQTVTLKSGA